MSDGDYVRAIERHVCQKNDGHLVRVVGPAFDVVCRWEREGVPLKIALTGIDRYFERYYRNGPKRRPVRVEFCDADVLDVFDEWRRAVGVAAASVREAAEAAAGNGRVGGGAVGPPCGGSGDKARGPSLRAHLERVVTRLSSARATGRLGADTDAVIDRLADELDRARADVGGLRGESRQALIARLRVLDRQLIDAAMAGLDTDERRQLEFEAGRDLAGFRDRMAPDAYAAAVRRSVERLLRERFGLPVVAFD